MGRGLEKLQCCCVGGGGGREGKLQDNLAFRLGEGRMLVTSALKLSTVANLHYQLGWKKPISLNCVRQARFCLVCLGIKL